jgi:diadenosine tetraphosphatase ApaH/serine/threonine PP2A family protein phosphatase
MRVAVISDIHGNLHALEAVIAELAAESLDGIWSLGDVVGYGPRPNRCCALVQERADISLAGNHDLGVLGFVELEEFSPDAAASALWTREVLSPEARAYLERLEPLARADGVELFHASPRDPIWDYVLTGEAALDALELTSEPLVVVGHSHLPLAVLLAGRTLSGGHAPDGTEVDLADGRWLLNPGSVGQPRDGDARAAYLLLDLEAGRASFRRIDYDVELTQAEIRERGLPEVLAARLAGGV